jgi:hypothetical protein
MHKKLILWISAVLITFLTVFLHQRLSVSYPVSGAIGIEGERLTYFFPKIHYGKEPFKIMVRTDKENLDGSIQWKRETDEEWNIAPLKKTGRFLSAEIIPQPAGTEIKYKAVIHYHNRDYEFPGRTTVNAKFVGKRPASVMYALYFFLYGGLLLSARGALEYFNQTDKKVLFSSLAAMFFFVASVVYYPFIRSYELDVINKTIPPIESLFDIPLLIIFLLWFTTAVFVIKFKNKIVLLFSGVLTLILFQLSSLY